MKKFEIALVLVVISFVFILMGCGARNVHVREPGYEGTYSRETFLGDTSENIDVNGMKDGGGYYVPGGEVYVNRRRYRGSYSDANPPLLRAPNIQTYRTPSGEEGIVPEDMVLMDERGRRIVKRDSLEQDVEKLKRRTQILRRAALCQKGRCPKGESR